MGAARPTRCRVHVEQSGDELVLQRRAGSFTAGAFLVVWMTGWTLGCVALAGVVAREPTAQHIAFALPFWASWSFVACLLAWSLFGTEHLEIGRDGLVYRTRAIIDLHERRVPLEEITGVGHYAKVTDSESGTVEHGLVVETLGRPIRFAQGVNRTERDCLAGQLQQHLQALVPYRTIAYRPYEGEQATAWVEVLGPENPPPGPPSDSTIRMRPGWNGVEFVRRGDFGLAAVGGATCLNLCWNGIVAAFVLQLAKNFAWPLCLLLVPFVGIGFVIFLVWLLNLAEPWRVERWAITPGEFVSRSSLFGLGWTRRYEAVRVGRVELQRGKVERKWRRKPPVVLGDGSDAPFSLVLVGRDGRGLQAMGELTEGEARWVGGVLREAWKGSLDRDECPKPVAGGTLWDRELDG